jgi:starch phosphorylase
MLDLEWAIGDGNEHGTDPVWSGVEAESLYDTLENVVINEFYNRNDHGLPTAWVVPMHEGMARLTPRFSADRTVREYTGKHYLPAAAECRSRITGKGAIGRQIIEWRHNLQQKWSEIHLGELEIETRGGQHFFDVPICLDELNPKAVQEELYAEGVMGGDAVSQEMKSILQPDSGSGDSVYDARVFAARPVADYTVRVIPHLNGVAVSLEEVRILWQH